MKTPSPFPDALYATLHKSSMPQLRRQAAADKDPTQEDRSTRAGALADAPQSYAAELQDSVPRCAQQCLTSYITQDYYCPRQDADCLCSHYSSRGYTLGELAVICLEQYCQDTSTAEKWAAYTLCNSRTRAVSPTHSTLTLPATTATRLATSRPTPTATHTLKSTPGPNTRTTRTSEVTRSTQATGTSNRGTMSSTAFSSAQSGAAQSAAAVSQPSSKQLPATHLTGAQAAGISIAAMGAVILAILIIYLIIYFRRRKVVCKDDRRSYGLVLTSSLLEKLC
jgi:hypothetical protein